MPLSNQGNVIHGYVMVIGPENNPNYFTGCGWSARLDEAKVFRTPGGAKCAAGFWERADYNPAPLPAAWRNDMHAEPVILALEPRLL